MKLPSKYLSLLRSSNSLVEPENCCVIAHSRSSTELEIFEFPQVIGHGSRLYYSNQPEHLEILTEKIAQVRAADAFDTSAIELTSLHLVESAIQQHLKVPRRSFSPGAVRACLNRIRVTFLASEIPPAENELEMFHA